MNAGNGDKLSLFPVEREHFLPVLSMAKDPTPGRSSAWLERLLWEQEAGGSNPLAPIFVTS